MRRIEKTTRDLKKAMGSALLELMKEKPVEKISIEEMTAKGDVGRSTYFRYFKNKDEVLTFKILCMFEDELEQRGLNIKTIPDDQFVNEVFDFFSRHQDIIERIDQAGHRSVFLDFFLRLIEPVKSKAADNISSLQVYYYSQIFAYVCYGFFNAWVDRGFKETPEQLQQLFQSNPASNESLNIPQ
ncbi:TetR/AcrR family transcriptional regulator [Ileibacterium valens]|uniref:TetR/AcrR family transcriptional regulator n=1 Tax=Ileibacterium valens TaxID=1862668 RepID=UPI0025B739DA|nr:TetR/AcrR family transcriptional regulator [Ileibacterium valens]